MYLDEVQYYEFGSYCLSVKNRQLLKDGKLVTISKKRFEILLFLVMNQGSPVSKQELIDKFWGESGVKEFNLIQHIYEIRKVLKENGGDEKYIETVPKYGYRFVAKVEIKKTKPTLEKKDSKKIIDYNDNVRSNKIFNEENLIIQHTANSDNNNSYKNKSGSKSINSFIFNKAFLVLLMSVFTILGIFSIYTQFFTKKNVETNEIKSIAILPFEQIEENSDEKWGLGIADSLITELSNQKKINILPTRTIARFASEKNISPVNIGKKLGVDAVLVGTIQKDGENVRVNTQLVSIKENKPLWTNKFDTRFSNIFSFQDKVTRHVAQNLSIKVTQNQKTDTQNTKNIEAFKAYSKGLFHMGKRIDFGKPSLIDSSEMILAIEHFENAIKHDPKFSKAYVKLVMLYTSIVIDHYDFIMSGEEAFSKAKKNAQQLINLDANSSEAYTVLAKIKLIEGNFNESRNLLNKAIRLQPNNVDANILFSWLNVIEGDWDEAILILKRVLADNPRNDSANMYLGMFYLLARKPNEALNFAKKRMETNPLNADINIYLARIYELKGQFDKSTEELKLALKKEPDNYFASIILGRIYAKKGEREKAVLILKQELKRLKAQWNRSDSDSNYYVALVYLQLNEKRKALNLIKDLKPSHAALLVLKNDYNLDSIKDTKELKEIISKMEKDLDVGN